MKNNFLFLLAVLLFVSSCADEPRFSQQNPSKLGLVKAFYNDSSGASMQEFPVKEVWSGKCVSDSDQVKLWGSAIIIDPNTHDFTVLGSADTNAEHYLALSETQILAEAGSSTRWPSVKVYESTKKKALYTSSTVNSATNTPSVYGIRRTTLFSQHNVLAIQEFVTDEVPTSCFYFHNKTSKTAEENQAAQTAFENASGIK